MAVGAAALTVGVVAALIVVFGYIPLPSFPDLRAEPDPSIPGEVAYLGYDEGPCLYVVAASGAEARRLRCDLGEIAWVAWTDQGRLLVASHGVREFDMVLVDPDTGETLGTVVDTVPVEAAFFDIDRTLHPDRGRLQVERVDDRIVLWARESSGETTEIVTISWRGDYFIWGGEVQWSPDGHWVLALDSASRLIVVAADGSGGPYLLAEDAFAPAWYVPGFDLYALDVEP